MIQHMHLFCSLGDSSKMAINVSYKVYILKDKEYRGGDDSKKNLEARKQKG